MYVLIIVLISSNGNFSTITAEFNGLKACRDAGQSIKRDLGTKVHYGDCIPKG